MKKHLLPTWLFLLSGFAVIAQETLLTGIITNQNNEPLIGANIYLKQKSFGTAADADGNFVLENVQPGDTLIFTSIGYETRKIAVDAEVETDYKIVLKEAAFQLSEVVVVADNKNTRSSLISCPSMMIPQDLLKIRELPGLPEHSIPTFHFSTFPNPTTGALTVIHEAPLNTLAIANANGQILKTFTDLNEKQANLDISAFPAGTYFLIQQDAAGNKSTGKVVLVK